MSNFVDEAMLLAADAANHAETMESALEMHAMQNLRAHLEAREEEFNLALDERDAAEHMVGKLMNIADQRDALLKQMAEALQSAGQALSWQCFGECRSYGESTPLLSPINATLLARTALAAYKESQ